MTNAHPPPAADLAARAQARIARLNQAAEALTTELGLPPEAKYEVLATVFEDGLAPAWSRTSSRPIVQHTAPWRALVALGTDFLDTLRGALVPQAVAVRAREKKVSIPGTRLDLPGISLSGADANWDLTAIALVRSPAKAGVEPDWSIDLSVIDQATGEPVSGQRVGLRVADQEFVAGTSADGEVHFDEIDPRPIVQAASLEFFIPDIPGGDH